MPERKRKRRAKPAEPEPRAEPGPRALWTGTLSFGLVTIPVALYPATRSAARMGLRMLAPDGTPLRREYVCPADDEPLERDAIMRGYELEDGEFVLLDDEELEGLAPDKSRDIDLTRFVEASELMPMAYERPYFLAPASDTTKAYRLLAQTLEAEGRVGIATFVLRGKEHAVAILSEGGILRAQTLRFASELRSPEAIPSARDTSVAKADVERFREAIRGLSEKDIDVDELTDTSHARLQALVERKLETGEDVVEPAAGAAPARAEVIDLMEVLKKALAHPEGEAALRGASRP